MTALHAPLIIDIAGKALTDVDRARLAHPLVGGIILFGRNWENREQLVQLCADIKAVKDDLLICVDHEGGRVQRFKTDGFTHIPPMRALGQMWMDDGKGTKRRKGSGAMRAMNAATAAGYVLGSELRACGVDFSFTPVLDLDYGASSVIGDRSFHRDPRVVATLAKSLMHGLITHAALTRTESRGAHIRHEYEQKDHRWEKQWIVFQQGLMNVRNHLYEHNQIKKYARAIFQ